jgi:hypothetical protein
MSSTPRFTVTKFYGASNLPLGKSRVKDLLGKQGLLRIIKADAMKPTKINAED